VQGKVTTGTDAVVQYAPMSDGKLVARSVSAQGAQNGQAGKRQTLKSINKG